MVTKSESATAQSYPKHPFTLTITQITEQLGTSLETGLGSATVQGNRSKYGENKLVGQGSVQWYRVFLKQLSNAMILVSVLLDECSAELILQNRFSSWPWPCHTVFRLSLIHI